MHTANAAQEGSELHTTCQSSGECKLSCRASLATSMAASASSLASPGMMAQQVGAAKSYRKMAFHHSQVLWNDTLPISPMLSCKHDLSYKTEHMYFHPFLSSLPCAVQGPLDIKVAVGSQQNITFNATDGPGAYRVSRPLPVAFCNSRRGN